MNIVLTSTCWGKGVSSSSIGALICPAVVPPAACPSSPMSAAALRLWASADVSRAFRPAPEVTSHLRRSRSTFSASSKDRVASAGGAGKRAGAGREWDKQGAWLQVQPDEQCQHAVQAWPLQQLRACCSSRLANQPIMAASSPKLQWQAATTSLTPVSACSALYISSLCFKAGTATSWLAPPAPPAAALAPAASAPLPAAA